MYCNVMTYVSKEDAELWVGMGVDGSFNYRQENILQSLSKVRHKVLGSENVTKRPQDREL